MHIFPSLKIQVFCTTIKTQIYTNIVTCIYILRHTYIYIHTCRVTLWERIAIRSDTSTGGGKTSPGRNIHFMNERACFILSHEKFPGFGSQMPFAVPIPLTLLIAKNPQSQHFHGIRNYSPTQGKALRHRCSAQKDFNPVFVWFGINLPLLQLHTGFFPVPAASQMLGDPDISGCLLHAQGPNAFTSSGSAWRGVNIRPSTVPTDSLT